MENIVLVGFGGHARSVADCIERSGQYRIIGYTDIEEASTNNGYTYLGTDDILEKIFSNGTRKAVVTVGQIGQDNVRQNIYKKLKDIGFELPIIADPSAIISQNCVIGEGTFVGKAAVINSNTTIGKMCIINSGVLCEHDNTIGDFCHIAVRAVCCGGVTVGTNSFIGANATIIQGISIGNGVTIGAGSLVRHNVDNDGMRYGLV